MDFLGTPTSFRLNALNSLPEAAQWAAGLYGSLGDNGTVSGPGLSDMSRIVARHTIEGASEGSDNASLMHMILLVSEAVLQVVCVSLPGYIIAKAGMFDTENQKFIASLNVSLFTPCLIFTKLASQLTMAKIVELAVIPIIFVFMTMVSYGCSKAVTKLLKLEKRAANFVIAMGVFGNSNSLPISLVLSLSMTISGLHWDRIPGDNDEEVGARGILYLLIFQQLGQLLRWTWGYNVLLAAPPKDDHIPEVPEERYRDEETDERSLERGAPAPNHDLLEVDPFLSPRFGNSFEGLRKLANQANPVLPIHSRHHQRHPTDDSAFESGQSGSMTPAQANSHPSSDSLSSEGLTMRNEPNGTTFPFPRATTNGSSSTSRIPKWSVPTPPIVKRVGKTIWHGAKRTGLAVWNAMNPPLWAMLAAIIVASIPALQSLIFTQGTLIETSFTRAVTQSGQVAVPLILVVLGANLANSTKGTQNSEHLDRQETKILIASVACRMFLPFVFIAPVLALAAKYINISILDDPIFVVVCFLLTGAPSALQLAQICQINNVYEDVITRVLFWSYVVVILPSTLILVITAIEVVHWAD